jgi:hypothetical protein
MLLFLILGLYGENWINCYECEFLENECGYLYVNGLDLGVNGKWLARYEWSECDRYY